ncbi:MAG: SRPBCC domain-containing protein [Acidobacteriota bacterium]
MSSRVQKEVVVEAPPEPRPSGRWYEVGVDGVECDWGHVLVWEPPRRIVLAWQLNAQWEYEPSLITEVEVTFTPVGDASTRVELEHRYLERFGEMEETVRQGIDSPEGWGGLLQMYADAARLQSVPQ